jgi:uncharacterized domain 1
MNATHPLFVDQASDLLPLDEISAMGGLAFMEGILRGSLPSPPICRTLNFHLVEVKEGSVAFEGDPQFHHCNPIGTIHGGWYGAVLDSCMACAVMTKLPKGKIYTTVEYKINIIRAIPIGQKIRATGVIDHVGRSTGVAHGTITDETGQKIFATGSTTCLIMTYPS